MNRNFLVNVHSAISSTFSYTTSILKIIHFVLNTQIAVVVFSDLLF